MPDDETDAEPPTGAAERHPELVANTRRARHYANLTMRGLVRWALRIALPLICANALLRALPYKASIAGVPFRVQGTLFTDRGFTADTTFGNWEFPHVDGLPIGVHVSPENVDLLRLSRNANPDLPAYVEQLKSGFSNELPWIVLWLLGVALLGVVLGLLMSAGLNMAIGYLRNVGRRPDELQIRIRQLGIAAIVLVLVGGYGFFTFNSEWTKQSRLTGTLGAAQLFPAELSQFYNRQSKVYDVLGSVVGIQSALQARIDAQNTPDTAYNIMFISDLHLAAVYPLVQQYVDSFEVKLIVNTGDESEFGTAAEMTPSYLAGLSRITAKVPMLWLAGNHDSPETVKVMSKIKGVTVLGGKQKQPDGTYQVTGSWVRALGLTVGGVPDPRVYGAEGVYGSAVDSETDALERDSMDAAVAKVDKNSYFDIMASHEPAATGELDKKLPDQIRQTNAGHTHAQNKTGDIQSGGVIDLVEGSTGAGGLDNINRGVPPPPIEFSIESVSSTCQFTKLLRFQLADPAAPEEASPSAVRDDVTVSTVYLKPQQIPNDRKCEIADGVSQTLSFDVVTEPTR